MTHDTDNDGKPSELRRQAENQLRPDPTPESDLSVEAARELVYELRLHQTELELQNEELRSTQQELEDANQRLDDLYQAAPVGYLSMTRMGRITAANQTLLHLLGVERERVVNDQAHRFVVEWDHSLFFDHLGRQFDTQAPQRCELTLIRGGLETFDASLDSMLACDRDGNVVCRTVVADISARKRAERGWRMADAIVEATGEGLLVIDLERRIVRVNQALVSMTGLPEEQLRGSDVDDLLSSDEVDDSEGPVSYLRSHDRWSGELRCRREDGSTFPARVSYTTLRDQRQRRTHYAALLMDITETRCERERIAHQAYHDAVTGLATRSLFAERLARSLREAHRHGTNVALLFLDLDSFKQINDQLGHAGGDAVLQEFARRLSACVRENDTVARVGGDEFALVLVDIEEARSAATVADKVLEAMVPPMRILGVDLYLTTSIGIALYPRDSEESDPLRRYADTAMYQAKAAGRNCYYFYGEEVGEEANRPRRLEHDLDSALGRGEFLLHYQPIIRADTGQLAGAEALVRWQHPQQGMLLPERFMHMSEESGQIRPLGEWVFRAACREMAQFTAVEPFISINVSMRQLHFTESLEEIRALLRETGFPPSRTVIEITESVPVHGDNGEGLQRLLALRRDGVRLALDDFGTGYSALGYLMRFPIDMLKIDQSFVRQVEQNEDAAQVVDAIIMMAHKLHIELVGEGVETAGQLDFLREHGCDYVQGYHIGEPGSMEGLQKWLESAGG